MKYNKKIHEEIIKKSHIRSMKYGVERERVVSKKILSGKDFVVNIRKNQSLIKAAVPMMNTLQEILQGSGFIIVLTDEKGCILNTIGDEDIMIVARSMNMITGAYMDEKSIGTNAMGVTIKEDIPIQISAKEHFVNAYHKWTCSAAPIHDIRGNIIGSINLTGAENKVHPHTLGLAVAAVRSIQNQLKADEINKKLEEAYQYMNTIIDSIPSGIYTINSDGIVKSINKYACKVLGIKEENIINNSVDNILPKWESILNKLKLGKTIRDKETIVNGCVNGRYNISAIPIRMIDEVVGMVVVFKEIQNVYKLINKYGGMSAKYTFDDIIGESDEIKRVVEFSKDIASSPSTILIQGESGTGKEVLAQSIHNYSNRVKQSFIAINCGAIPKSLIESELFGYEEGAFTGSKNGGHSGKFELANGGTLFLDEIGEMPLDMQVKLLRVLQEGYVTRVGGNKIIPVDVRIIAATNKNLEDEVKKGTFREDLYYRLKVIPIKLPSLRERNGDLKILIEHYLKLKSAKLKKDIPNMDEKIFREMMSYHWPGNIRELENYIENLVNLNGKTTFKLNVRKENDEIIFSNEEKNEEVYSIKKMEIKLIKKCLKKYSGNISKTAKILGISRNTLYLKMKKYEILI
ncbi:sigma-54-dependent Fis family transcriptional regulator [Clostridium botulinum]|uniref:ATPase AAA n=1 Tax=Clostridium botulinum C/D str. DC5 TaxID=1443128 RepID=A0A0A0IA63_CLOBO|nr:sigma-54-dependent Fis family transcriptional regulator [Clostridium botulinum]KEI05585.1 ATPase AAA [Clostridium botulinum C/D str. BKT75002]KEI09660.1 ATPase AAA [Clostridium botulinum C/D str. BKT2873]KGM95607.1 ATPase AAA [Clostridium botulinum D str. CCUG 7971]KGM97777.1 ATPase AAA [Clostridium botulinum C/D str. DC5]KOC49256.1 AAA family ATPase [Clostridium botulinum]